MTVARPCPCATVAAVDEASAKQAMKASSSAFSGVLAAVLVCAGVVMSLLGLGLIAFGGHSIAIDYSGAGTIVGEVARVIGYLLSALGVVTTLAGLGCGAVSLGIFASIFAPFTSKERRRGA